MIRRVKALELAAEVGVDARQYRRKLREAAATGHIKWHIKNQRWAVVAWSRDHGEILSVLETLVSFYGAGRFSQLKKEFFDMTGSYPPEIPPR